MGIINRITEIVRTIRFTASPRLYGRSSSGAGNGEEISIGSGLTLTGGVLSATGASSIAWGEVTGKPATFTPSTHTHAISDVANLQTTLDGKAATSHTHAEFTTLTPTTPPISTNEVKATATITVTDIPTIGQTLTIGGIVYTFAASQVNPFDIAITEPASTTTVATAITTRINARDRNVVATRSGAVITLTAIALREDGNLVTLTTTASNLTLSGSSLTGGASTTATATTGNNMQHAVVASRHVFICVNSGFSTNWILIS